MGIILAFGSTNEKVVEDTEWFPSRDLTSDGGRPLVVGKIWMMT